jgi:uncharacterized tellurite resistance protein B-like protein
MLERLISLLRGELQAEAAERGPFERRLVAVAALLLETMYVDRVASEAEHEAVKRLLMAHFHLPTERVEQLVALAEVRYAEALDDWEFAEAVRVGFVPAERQEILTMLWEVAYADGVMEKLEGRLMRRLARQLELGDDAAELARAAAGARSGLLRGTPGES